MSAVIHTEGLTRRFGDFLAVDHLTFEVQAGQVLLVCAYEDPERFATMRLEGAISIQEFRARRPSLPKDQEIIFYCG